jgi:hypothetical protein
VGPLYLLKKDFEATAVLNDIDHATVEAATVAGCSARAC